MIEWHWLGTVPYGEALERQRAFREQVIARTEPETIWILEHPPVLTTGRRAVPDLPPKGLLDSQGIALFETERGGLATYHGPGQLVAYVFVDAFERGLGVRGTVGALESGIIAWLGTQGVAAGRNRNHRGVWVGSDKICAVGLHFRKGVSMHGLALNLTTDLAPYELFTPCGIHDGGVTSLARLAGRSPSPREAAAGVALALSRALTRGLPRLEPPDNGERP
jgi:lipoate-protein ligase B